MLFFFRASVLSCCLLLKSFIYSETLDFKKDIQPIFNKYCLDCHGPEKQKSGFRIDQRSSLVKGGDYGLPAIIPGDPERSYLLEAIRGDNPDEIMPPKGKKLNQEQVQLIADWIAQGAIWPDQMKSNGKSDNKISHWSFQPINKPTPPVSKHFNPIDAFVEAKLIENGLSFSKEAAPETLLRRLSLTLIGLPPALDEVEQAINLKELTDEIYQKWVQQKLMSPQYGEKWVQHWLDTIRFADTRGYEFNSIRPNAWPYRDYVIQAFNQDKPWDQFIIEQIAGDTLGIDAPTGFLVTAPFPSPAEVGKEPDQIKQARYNSLDEVIQNIGVSMLGITLGCARCHNHKFDPVSMEDYYGLVATFEGLNYGERLWRENDDPQREINANKALMNYHETQKLIKSYPVWRERQHDRVTDNFSPIQAKFIRIKVHSIVKGKPGVIFDEIEVYSKNKQGKNTNIALLSKGAKVKTSGGTSHVKSDNVLIDGKFGNQSQWFSMHKANQADWVEIEFPQVYLIHQFSWSRGRHLISQPEKYKNKMAKDYEIEFATQEGQWKTLISRERKEGLSEFDYEKRTNLEQDLTKYKAEYRPLQKGPQVYAGSFTKPDKTYFFHRGNPLQPKHQVAPSSILFLNGYQLKPDTIENQRRLELAKWIANPENPLTARVLVNRIWHHHFGTGLVSTPSDFGTQGERPSHPDLLDWLASELIENQWSVKHIHRLILNSKTWKQQSLPHANGMKFDPGSRLLWRFPPRRLDAESIRDSLLHASNQLDHKMGGPGFNVYQKKPSFGEWKPKLKLGPDANRRMIYMMKMRAADDGMFKVFDIPDCGQVRAKRGNSTTPLQALNLFNGSFIYQQAQMLSDRVHKEAGESTGINQKIERLFLHVLSRKPKSSEMKLIAEVVKKDSLTSAARALLNTNEFLYIF